MISSRNNLKICEKLCGHFLIFTMLLLYIIIRDHSSRVNLDLLQFFVFLLSHSCQSFDRSFILNLYRQKTEQIQFFMDGVSEKWANWPSFEKNHPILNIYKKPNIFRSTFHLVLHMV